MAKIHVLSQDTINKIAAGEVIERPMAVVKELVENAIDAGALAITVEISDGGKSLIRVTDNGSGMDAEDIRLAFTPHATSKIKDVTDLLDVPSLGFRGEALASIAAVSQLEMVTKTKEAFMGSRYQMDGGTEKEFEQVGCPEGTTFLVRNLFYNTPARLEFLKTTQTEAGYVSSLIERMALSHPEIAFRFINQKQQRLSTAGNGNLKDVIYHIYGRDITSNLIPVDRTEEFLKVEGFLAKPVVSRGNRAMMNYFINGRYIKSNIISKAIEDAYAPYTMQHRYPFTALHFTIRPEFLDVNVHPQKMELRFHKEKEIFQNVYDGITETLKYREFIPEVTFQTKEEIETERKEKENHQRKTNLEPFEKKRKEKMDSFSFVKEPGSSYGSEEKKERKEEKIFGENQQKKNQEDLKKERKPIENPEKTSGEASRDTAKDLQSFKADHTDAENSQTDYLHIENQTTKKAFITGKQESLFGEGMLSGKEEKEIKIIGQVFSTYWILQYEDKMYLIDQHAAHEKVLYERFMKEIQKKEVLSQMLEPPIILSLSMRQQLAVEENKEIFKNLGYLLEPFGGKEYAVSGVPAHLPNIGTEELLLEVIDTLTEDQGSRKASEVLTERVATMSCKAAVKGNNTLAFSEVEELLKELMTLENPYHCPHGRPTMISMSKTELEKRFKRIV